MHEQLQAIITVLSLINPAMFGQAVAGQRRFPEAR